MALLKSKKSKEFWGFMVASLAFYLLSLLFTTEDLKNILIVASAALFIVALLRLRKE